MFDFGISHINGLLQLGDRLVGYWQKWRKSPVPETLAGRFIRLFESHGVHRNQIPRFFGHGLQIKDVQDDAVLLQSLTDDHLGDACALWGVQRQWLERGEGQSHARHFFYLEPKAFAAFTHALVSARTSKSQAELIFTLFGSFDSRDLESTLVISEPVGELNDETIYRYHYVDAGPLGYWKSRVSTAGIVAQALVHKGWLSGRDCEPNLLTALLHDKDLVGVADMDQLTRKSRRVEIDDWLLQPDALLAGVDPETNKFGIRSALELWLAFEAQGYLKHPFANQGVRQKFEEALQARG